MFKINETIEFNSKENSYYTYGMIKPDGMENKEEIVKMILSSGLKIRYYKCDMLTDELIDENYSHVKEKYPEDFKFLKKSLKSGPVLMMLIYDPEGNAIKKYRDILGCTNSWEASPNTIRGKFGDREKVYKNAAHGSGNLKEAQEETIRFFGSELFNVFGGLVWLSDYEKGLTYTGCSLDKASNYTDKQIYDLIIKECNDYVKKMGL